MTFLLINEILNDLKNIKLEENYQIINKNWQIPSFFLKYM